MVTTGMQNIAWPLSSHFLPLLHTSVPPKFDMGNMTILSPELPVMASQLMTAISSKRLGVNAANWWFYANLFLS